MVSGCYYEISTMDKNVLENLIEESNKRLRDSKGRFVSKNYIKTITNPISENDWMEEEIPMNKNSTYTVYLDITCIYEIDIKASSFEDALEKARNLKQWEVVTKNKPVDSQIDEDNYISGIIKQCD